jgi:branched-chain amino acid aminotransferase
MLQKFDKRNESLKIWVGDRLFDREEAKVSVFDSVVQGGDAVWEGLRLYKEGLFLLDRHLKRLQDSSKALLFQHIPSSESIISAIKETLLANGMTHDTHIRLTLTRGKKITSGMDPRLNQDGCTLIILPEWKPAVYDNENGLRIITSAIRRNNPSFLDSKIHHNNLLNNIQAKIQANIAQVDAALMLDINGFAAELNGTNIFTIKEGKVYTPFADACLHGITRGFILELCKDHRIPVEEKNISMTEIYTADEIFCSGTMGELTPIYEVDGRIVEKKKAENSLFHKINNLFKNSRPQYCYSIT